MNTCKPLVGTYQPHVLMQTTSQSRLKPGNLFQICTTSDSKIIDTLSMLGLNTDIRSMIDFIPNWGISLSHDNHFYQTYFQAISTEEVNWLNEIAIDYLVEGSEKFNKAVNMLADHNSQLYCFLKKHKGWTSSHIAGLLTPYGVIFRYPDN